MGSVSELLLAPEARPHRPIEMQVTRSAALSRCGAYRWSLRRFWSAPSGTNQRVLPWIMLNPSTADATIDDPTLRRIIGFSWRWGFDGLLVVNLFPLRSPHPSVLREWVRWDERRDWDARDTIRANYAHVADLLAPYDAAMAAWGAQTGPLGFEVDLAADALFDAINDPDAVRAPATRKRVLELFCLGETGGGDPKHPMARGKHRVPDDAVPQPIGRYPGTVTAAPFEASAKNSPTTGANP